MRFRDTVSIGHPVGDTYHQKPLIMFDVPANLAITGGVRRGGTIDPLAGDAVAYLDAQAQTLRVNLGYQLEGAILVSQQFGISRTWRVTSVAYGTRPVTGAPMKHIEVQLEEIKQ